MKKKKMKQYIWQKKFWPTFTWKTEEIMPSLLEARKAQGYILGQANFFELKELGELIVEEAITTSAIEGEKLDKNSVRSSVARRLGLPTAGLPETDKISENLVELLIDATTNYSTKLTKERLWGWQAALFPSGYSGIHKINVGSWRKTKNPMQVISGPMGREKIHFEAPPSSQVSKEMTKFFSWWNSPEKELDGIIRAAMAHLWFVTIHPFDDGNGRVARAITDLALAQEEKQKKRLYSLSLQIVKDKKNYYQILEETQKGNGDITKWLHWFLNTFIRSINHSKALIEKSLFIGRFYKYHTETNLNERQKKVLKKLLDQLPKDFDGGLTNKKYVSITKVSSETAKRDLKDLVQKGILLLNNEKGRSTSYRLNRDI